MSRQMLWFNLLEEWSGKGKSYFEKVPVLKIPAVFPSCRNQSIDLQCKLVN